MTGNYHCTCNTKGLAQKFGAVAKEVGARKNEPSAKSEIKQSEIKQ